LMDRALVEAQLPGEAEQLLRGVFRIHGNVPDEPAGRLVALAGGRPKSGRIGRIRGHFQKLFRYAIMGNFLKVSAAIAWSEWATEADRQTRSPAYSDRSQCRLHEPGWASAETRDPSAKPAGRATGSLGSRFTKGPSPRKAELFLNSQPR
jgi:hypothetical protein